MSVEEKTCFGDLRNRNNKRRCTEGRKDTEVGSGIGAQDVGYGVRIQSGTKEWRCKSERV